VYFSRDATFSINEPDDLVSVFTLDSRALAIEKALLIEKILPLRGRHSIADNFIV
jgi:hypothetical protein